MIFRLSLPECVTMSSPCPVLLPFTSNTALLPSSGTMFMVLVSHLGLRKGMVNLNQSEDGVR